MLKNLAAALLVIAFGFLALPLRAADNEPDKGAKDKAAADFADKLLTVADEISEHYYIEISREELIEYAVRGLYQHLRTGSDADVEEWPRKVRATKKGELRSLLLEVRKDVGQFGGISSDRFFDLALEGMTQPLDGKTYLRFGPPGCRIEGPEQQHFVGVGLKLRPDASSGMIQVVTPLLGGPAYTAGIRAGDLLTQITLLVDSDGKPLAQPRVVSTKGLSLTEALYLLRGESGTRVGLTIQRPGEGKPRNYKIARGATPVETVFGFRRKDDDHWNYWLDADKKIAYVRLAVLGADTAGDLGKVVDALRKDGLKGLVLDLRFNPHGLLPSVIDVCDLFIDDGVIVSLQGRGRTLETFKGKQEGSQLGFPIVCLVNGETTEWGEIVAACLQDHDRAVVMGERTKGDGSGQNIRPLWPGEASLKITTAIFHRPSGKKLDRAPVPDTDPDEWGVSPEAKDVVRLSDKERRDLEEYLDRQTLILPPEQYGKDKGPAFKDRQLERAVAHLRALGEKP